MSSPIDRMREFAEGWSRMNTDAMRRYVETQTEAMQRYAEANQELFQSLQNMGDLSAAAQAQRAFMEKLQANATETFEKQNAIARETGEEVQRVIRELFQPPSDGGR